MQKVKIATEQSFIHFVYSFLFDADGFDRRIEAFQNAVRQGCNGEAKRVWTEMAFPEEDLLSHVRDYLNPKQGAPATACLWKLNFEDMQYVFGLDDAVEWHLVQKELEIPFQWEHTLWAAQLALFRVGVGFLTVRVKPASEKVDDWLNFLHYFRYVNSRIANQMEVSVRAQRRTPSGQVEPFFLAPASKSTSSSEEPKLFSILLKELLRSGAFENERDEWWEEVYVKDTLIPFAVLYVDGEPNEETGSRFERLLYRVHRFFPADRYIIPSASDLDFNSHPAFLPYVQDQWFTFSLEGGAFVACNAPKGDEFFRQILIVNLSRQYFLLFLLALHQRFALMRLSQLVSKHWLGNTQRERLKIFNSVRDQLLAFTARGYFTQVMQRENHHRCYRKWQEVFQVEALYREVSDEVREMHEILQARRSEALNLFAWLLGPPALLLTISNAVGQVSLPIAILLVLVGLAIGLLILMQLQVVQIMPRLWFQHIVSCAKRKLKIPNSKPGRLPSATSLSHAKRKDDGEHRPPE